jgi:two-component system response regulator AlgR
MSVRILIVDDEPPARMRLCELLATVPGASVVGETGNGTDAVALCGDGSVDLVLLDIRMPGIDGLETAQALARLPQPPIVVFLTAYDDRAIDAFERGAIDYLLKPVRAERLMQAIERAQRLMPARMTAVADARRYFVARKGSHVQRVPVDEVIFLRAEDKYVRLVTAGAEHLIEDSLASIEQEFGDRFLRIHRNCLVATDRIRGIRRTPQGTETVLVDGIDDALEISRRNLPAVRVRLTRLD